MSGEAASSQLIEGFVVTTAARYMGYRFAMLGALTQALVRLRGARRYEDAILTSAIRQIVQVGIDTEVSVIESATQKVLAADSEAAQVSASKEIASTVGLITEQLRRDARKILRYFKAILLAVEHYRSQGLTQEESVAKAETLRSADLQFKYLDAAGREWSAERYLEVVVRSHFYQVLNSARLEKMRLDGARSGVIHNPNGSSDGVHFAVGVWGSIKAKFFHPNSRAILSRGSE